MFLSKSFAMALLFLPAQVVSQACLNDQTYFYNSNPKRTCSNIRIKESRRQLRCPLEEVRTACPQTCGVCCEDDPTFTFPLEYDSSIMQGCSWITKNAARTATRQATYCGTDYFIGSTTVRNMCPLACDFCQTYITVAPSSSPSTSGTPAPTVSPTSATTGSPTLSASPTISPTRPPSPMPSPFPTLKPTSIPSETPSENPSASPSDVPTKNPSAAPSGVPTFLPSASPSKNPSAAPSESPSQDPSAAPSGVPTKSPSGSPSKDPSAEPSDIPSSEPSFKPSQVPTVDPSETPTNNPTESIKPSATPSIAPVGPPTASPTTSPTVSPSMSPVAATNSPTESCVDSATFEFEMNTDPTMTQPCSWLTKNLSKAATRIGNYCGFTDVKFNCPVSCSACDETCEDDATFTFPLITNPSVTQNCAWITKNNVETRQDNYCDTVGDSCPASCDFCP